MIRHFRPLSARLAFEGRPVRLAAAYGHRIPGEGLMVSDLTRCPKHAAFYPQVAQNGGEDLADAQQWLEDRDLGVGHRGVCVVEAD